MVPLVAKLLSTPTNSVLVVWALPSEIILLVTLTLVAQARNSNPIAIGGVVAVVIVEALRISYILLRVITPLGGFE